MGFDGVGQAIQIRFTACGEVDRPARFLFRPLQPGPGEQHP